MKDRIALVTGSNRGMGRDTALRLADITAGVAVHYKEDRLAAEEVVTEIHKKGKLSEAFQADLTIEKETLSFIREVIQRLGRVDILVNNYGPILVKSWEKVTAKEWEGIFRSNVASAVFCSKAVLPEMRERKWGRIINIGYSRAEQLVAFPTITPYAIAKTGLLILTRTMASTEASSGITVNMVSPGLLKGGILPSVKNISCGKLGQFKDVSSSVLFLASNDSASITGTNLIVAGGWKL